MNKSLIGKKVKSSYNEAWHWNGSTVIDVIEDRSGDIYYLLEKEGHRIYTSQWGIEEL